MVLRKIKQYVVMIHLVNGALKVVCLVYVMYFMKCYVGHVLVDGGYLRYPCFIPPNSSRTDSDSVYSWYP